MTDSKDTQKEVTAKAKQLGFIPKTFKKKKEAFYFTPTKEKKLFHIYSYKGSKIDNLEVIEYPRK